jgi:hypothetical protein
MDDLGFISKLGKLPKSGRIVASTIGVLGAIALLTSNNKREVFNHEEHDEIDELIEDLDKLTAFCIGFLHDGAYGGESLGREDLGDGMEEERVRYVEGSIELKFVYEDGEVILIRASYPNEDNGPVIYLPPPKFIRDKPEGERTRMGAEYTPSQTLSDYTPEQLATSSTITGDFTQDAVKYSNTRYAAESDEATLKKYEKTYGKDGAKVRLRLKKKIMKQNTYGTKSGQWSARKSQKLNKEYEEEMEKKGKKAYKSSKRTSAQKDLKKWGDQKWRTKSGKKSSVTGERYLPDKAIKALTDKEYKKTTAAKRKAKKAGKQFSKQPKSIAKKVAKYRAEYEVGTQGPCWDGYTYVGPEPLAKGSCRRD